MYKFTTRLIATTILCVALFSSVVYGNTASLEHSVDISYEIIRPNCDDEWAAM